MQYEKSELTASNVSLLPLRMDTYSTIIDIFKKGWGDLFNTTYYIAQPPEYKQQYMFFERFCFDVVSLLGEHLYHLTHRE